MLLQRVLERKTTFPAHAEQYHLLEMIFVEWVGLLPLVISLRDAGATVTPTKALIRERNVGGILKDFPSTQHHHTSARLGAYCAFYQRTDGAGHRR